MQNQQIDHSSNQFPHFTRPTQINHTQQRSQLPPPNTPPQIQNPDIDDPILSLVSADHLLVHDPHVLRHGKFIPAIRLEMENHGRFPPF
jgi:hypothetical protein